MSKGKVLPGLFGTQDESIHRMMKKPIAGVYSMSNLTSFESLVDSTIDHFLNQLRTRFVIPEKVCDWGLWLQYFAVSRPLVHGSLQVTLALMPVLESWAC